MKRKEQPVVLPVSEVATVEAALKFGKQISDPATWANKAARDSLIARGLMAIPVVLAFFGHPLPTGILEHIDLNLVADVISAGVGWFLVRRANRRHIAANPNAGAKSP
jgi:hypothetical protein